MSKRVCFILSLVHQSNELEWIIEGVKDKYDLSIVLLNPLDNVQFRDSKFENYIKNSNIPLNLINYNGKRDFVKAFLQVFVYLRKQKPNIVHAQLFDASLIGLLASFLLGIKHRIYTRHHSSFHHDFFPQAVKYDKLINKLSTKIIAISVVVKDILIDKEGVKQDKITLIHHGNKLNKIAFDTEKIVALKNKYLLNNSFFVIGVISRYIEWKGVQYIVPAYEKILKEYPNTKLVLAGIGGAYRKNITHLLEKLPKESFIEIEFENDVWNLYKTFDVFVHVPINNHCEAFGQIYIEAMHSEVPLVCTLSGVANEVLVHEKNALICDYQSEESIYLNLKRIIEDKELKYEITQRSHIDSKQFTFEKKITSILDLYEKCE